MALYATREQRKWAAKRRAELALQQAFDRIDYLEDVVKPELEAMAKKAVVLVANDDNAQAAKDALGDKLSLEASK